MQDLPWNLKLGFQQTVLTYTTAKIVTGKELKENKEASWKVTAVVPTSLKGYKNVLLGESSQGLNVTVPLVWRRYSTNALEIS